MQWREHDELPSDADPGETLPPCSIPGCLESAAPYVCRGCGEPCCYNHWHGSRKCYTCQPPETAPNFESMEIADESSLTF